MSIHTHPDLWITDGPENAKWQIALAHGAGVSMDSDFMNFFADRLAKREYRVVRFEFPYMAERRTTGSRKPPNREPVLRETWLEVIESLGPERLIISGKSLGGRIASLIADDSQIAGVACLGYPFHAVGKPDQLRIAHLKTIQVPMLILQGERDPFGNADEVPHYDLPARIQIHWLKDGDHGFKPRQSSGLTQLQNWEEAAECFASWLRANFNRDD